MSKPIPALPVKLIFSILANDHKLINDTIDALSNIYGMPDYISARMPFDYTDYYCREMGKNLFRRFLTMEMLIDAEKLPDVKLKMNKIEEKTSVEGQRGVNIDPGYLSAAHLILATGKGYAHRPYLRDGIYADLTLIFQAGKFFSLPWTYPDYAEERQKMMFAKIRAKYLLQLKEERQ
ncbi:MAG TPA: DUF4416 family protein [Deltaproteobacteria bacterium]|nr:DUF4416 family protein [Deltaproteobacteria bacterium]